MTSALLEEGEAGSEDVEEGMRRGALWDCLEFRARATRVAGIVVCLIRDSLSRLARY